MVITSNTEDLDDVEESWYSDDEDSKPQDKAKTPAKQSAPLKKKDSSSSEEDWYSDEDTPATVTKRNISKLPLDSLSPKPAAVKGKPSPLRKPVPSAKHRLLASGGSDSDKSGSEAEFVEGSSTVKVLHSFYERA